MKIPSTTTFAALVALTAHPAAFAQDAAEPILPEIAICEMFPCEEILIEEPIIIVCPGLDEGLVTIDPVVDIEDPTVKEEEAVTEEEVVTEEEIVSEEEFISEETADGEVVEITTEEEGAESGDGGEVAEWQDGGVPIEWVKRGGGELDNPDVIFYSMAGGPVLQNMAGGPSPAADPSTGGTATRVLNQGETAADIEGTATGGSVVAQAAKKSTVAIVKQGRVFLR